MTKTKKIKISKKNFNEEAMTKNILKLFNILKINKNYLFFIIFLFIASSMIDLLSIGLIAPYVSVILDIENNFF